ncbi:replication initiator 1-like [Python bivittatus]|uniref:Replication initiator 1-like n=1 Tax=Python bivittatus TaxID=176946 RepID=A0A9F5IUV0_PYTBI|nr:replication initiator 1-like [Python bivittatus]
MLRETYKALVLVGGRLITSAEVFAWVEKNERLNVPKPVRLLDDPPSGILSAIDADRSPTGKESFPEQGDPLEATCALSKEETTGRSYAEGSPERSRVPAVGGSAFDSGGSLSRAESELESAGHASGDASPEEVPLPCQLRAELPRMPVPVAAPEKLSEQKSRPCGTTVLPQPGLATHAEDRLEEMQLAHAACDENCTGSLRPPSAPALVQSTGRAQGPQPQPPEVPVEEEKPFSCAWCKGQFKLQVNLEAHYRYCRQRARRQPGPPADPLRPPRVPGKQGPSGSGSTRGSAGPPLPAPALARSPSAGKFLKFILCQPQRKQKTGKHRGVPHLGGGAADSPRSLAMVSVTKKLCRCQECGEKFVYKWQLSAHLRAHAESGGCGGDVGGQSPLPKQARDQAAERAHDGARSREACVAPAVLRRRAQDRPLYPCGECGKSFTKHYLPTHRAFHAGLRYKCLLCGKIFSFQSGAQLHKKRHREKGDSATCPQCGKSAGAKDCFCMIKKISIAPKPDCGEGRGQADEPR